LKKLTLLFLNLIFSITGFSQVTLSYEKNAFLKGDSICSREIAFVEAGESGPFKVWDFSKIQFTGNSPVSFVPTGTPQEKLNVSNFNLKLDEFGYEYYFNITQSQMEEVALTIKGISLVYTDPIIKLKYPFIYGQNYTDKFAGLATYPDGRTNDISGDYSVTADAYGTLILPDGIFNNALRLKIEKNSIQVNSCGPTESRSIRYVWFVPQIRYSVLSTNVTEIRSPGREPRITRTAFVNQQKKKTNILNAQSYGNNTEVSTVAYPSPFNKILYYQYFLPKQMPVSIELLTMEGKNNITIVKNVLQSEGLHTGEIDGSVYVLNPGVYFLRYTFDKKVIVSKVVKMQ